MSDVGKIYCPYPGINESKVECFHTYSRSAGVNYNFPGQTKMA